MLFQQWRLIGGITKGITRDVMLVTTPRLFIRDYFVRLDSVQKDLIHATVTLSAKGVRDVRIEIPELNIERTLQTNEEGVGRASLKVRKLELWEPEHDYIRLW